MGQYYLCYVNHNGKQKVFDNYVDKEREGLKIMEHSWWLNSLVGNVVNDLFYNKGQVCWVGDYYYEDDYAQVNCGKELVKAIGEYVWNNKEAKKVRGSSKKVRYLTNLIIVNHTKKQILVCDDYYAQSSYTEKWYDEEWQACIHPLPLLTCSANHSGGSYYGPNQEDCGIWFNDVLEIMLSWDKEKLLKKGYHIVNFFFQEKQ